MSATKQRPTPKPCSQTALTSAAARGAHLIVDAAPLIFEDTLAVAVLGERAEELIAYHRLHGDHLVLSSARTQVLCRSRYTEDRLAASVLRGVRQYVILGAGLDTFGYRAQLAPDADQADADQADADQADADQAGAVRVFEVDHPATQQWKRRHLATAGIPVPQTVRYVPIDLETEPLIDRLVASGFDLDLPAFVSWLGVTMYLTRAAIAATLATLGTLAPGTELVADHMVPAELRDEIGQSYVDQVASFAAEHGEPWLSFLSPDEMSLLLAEHGFRTVETVRQHDMVEAGWPERTDALRPSELSRITRAVRTAHTGCDLRPGPTAQG